MNYKNEPTKLLNKVKNIILDTPNLDYHAIKHADNEGIIHIRKRFEDFKKLDEIHYKFKDKTFSFNNSKEILMARYRNPDEIEKVFSKLKKFLEHLS